MFKILIAEDDREVSRLFAHVLLKNGYSVSTVENGRQALEILEKETFDLIISDIMMPFVDGYELVQTLRSEGNKVPVLMITAKSEFDDMQMGFLSGSDDYMVKPVNVNEMLLRVKALLRRAQMVNDRNLVIGSTVLDYDKLTLSHSGVEEVLPQKEFKLLYKLASYPDRFFTRQQLMDDIWGYDSGSDTHTVEVHIGRLRDRLRENPDLEIVTMRGLGYKAVRS